MGSILNELRRTAIARGIKNFLGDTRTDSGVERYSETLQPVLDPWTLPETAFLRGEVLGANSQQQGAVAAQFGAYGCGIPLTSDIIVVVDMLSAAGAAAETMIIERLTHAQLAAGVATLAFSIQTRDRRNGDFVAGLELFSGTSATATLGQAIERINVLAGDTGYSQTACPHVLVPGQAIVIIGQNANAIQNSSLKVRSRARLRTERV